MKKISNKPQVLQNKILLTFLMGFVCFIFGVGYFVFAQDRIFLVMSTLLMFACFARGIELYIIVLKNKFEILTGTCVGISSNPMRKLRNIKLMDKDGNEFVLKLQKTDKLIIGKRYRFYFKKHELFKTSYDFVDARMSTDNFLGYEQLSSLDDSCRKNPVIPKSSDKASAPKKRS